MSATVTVTTSPTGSVLAGVPFSVSAQLSSGTAGVSIATMQTSIFPSGALNYDQAAPGIWPLTPNDIIAIPASGSGSITKTTQAAIYGSAQSGNQVFGVNVLVWDTGGAVSSGTAVYVTCSNITGTN